MVVLVLGYALVCTYCRSFTVSFISAEGINIQTIIKYFLNQQKFKGDNAYVMSK